MERGVEPESDDEHRFCGRREDLVRMLHIRIRGKVGSPYVVKVRDHHYPMGSVCTDE